MKRSQVFGSAEVREEKLTPNEHPLISKIARACKNRVRWVSRIALKNKKPPPSFKIKDLLAFNFECNNKTTIFTQKERL